MVKVSIIIPTSDRQDLLLRAISSIFVQDFSDFEVIVVDDGAVSSMDKVKEIYGDKVFYLKNDKKLGAAATRNRGISEANGVYFAFLDDDDQWLPSKLRLQVEALDKSPSDVGFSYTAVKNCFNKKIEITNVPDGVNDLSIISLTRFKGFLTSTLLVRKSLFEELGVFDEGLPSHQEAELILRFSQTYKGFGINMPLVIMDATTNHEHIGSKLSRRIEGREKLLKIS